MRFVICTLLIRFKLAGLTIRDIAMSENTTKKAILGKLLEQIAADGDSQNADEAGSSSKNIDISDKLSFYKDYIIQTRKEIDTEKIEMTKLVNIKILVVGSIFAFKDGPAVLITACLIPLFLCAIDMIHAARLRYILHRWSYLNEHITPKVKNLLGDDNDIRFFETSVVDRDKKDVYWNMENRVRGVFMGISLAIAVFSSHILWVQSGNATSNSDNSFQIYELISVSVFIIISIFISSQKIDWHIQIKEEDSNKPIYNTRYIWVLVAISSFISLLDGLTGNPIANFFNDAIRRNAW